MAKQRLQLQMPDDALDALKSLAGVTAAGRMQLTQAIRGAAKAFDPDDLVNEVKKAVDPGMSDVSADFLRVLLSLVWVRLNEKVEADALAADVVAAMKASETNEPADGWPAFEADLAAQIAIDVPLAVASKALDIRAQHQRVFRRARILTDLRPVYGVDASVRPAAAVIVHTLRLEYVEAGTGTRRFFIALDAADLKELRGLLDRAEKKEASLSAMLETSGLSIIQATRG